MTKVLILIKLTITKKIILSFMMIWITGSGLIIVSSYIYTKSQLFNDIKSRLTDYAEIGIMGFPADDHSSINGEEDYLSDHYNLVVEYLRELKLKCNDVIYIYTLRRISDNSIVFIGDAETDEETLSYPGDVYDEPSDLILEIIDGFDEVAIEKDFVEDEWGNTISAYAPIYN